MRCHPTSRRRGIRLSTLIFILSSAQIVVCVWRWEYGAIPNTVRVDAWLQGHDAARFDIDSGRAGLRRIGVAPLTLQEYRDSLLPVYWEEANWCPYRDWEARDAYIEGYNAEVLRAFDWGELDGWLAEDKNDNEARWCAHNREAVESLFAPPWVYLGEWCGG